MSSVVSLAVALVVSVSGYLIASHLIHKLAVARFTVLNELEDLGQDRKPGQKLKGTAVICGGRYATTKPASASEANTYAALQVFWPPGYVPLTLRKSLSSTQTARCCWNALQHPSLPTLGDALIRKSAAIRARG